VPSATGPLSAPVLHASSHAAPASGVFPKYPAVWDGLWAVRYSARSYPRGAKNSSAMLSGSRKDNAE
jgi:hypothetical protein